MTAQGTALAAAARLVSLGAFSQNQQSDDLVEFGMARRIEPDEFHRPLTRVAVILEKHVEERVGEGRPLSDGWFW
jgi:hypothetical protein